MSLLALLLALPVLAATDPDLALRMSLEQSRAALHAAFTPKSPFSGQVQSAYSGYDDVGEATQLYLSRGMELRQTLGVVAAQLEAAKGQLPGTTAAIKRRVDSARGMAQLYLVLPRDVASLDAKGGGSEELRAIFISAMNKIAVDADYLAAEALRIRAVEELTHPRLRF